MKKQVTTCCILLIALNASGHESKNLNELPAGFDLGRGDPALFSNRVYPDFAH